MKKNLFVLSVLSAALSLIGCSQDGIEDIVPAIPVGEEVEIFAATPDTRTTNDGLNTVWAEGDQLTIFCAEAGTTEYGDNHQFTLDDATTGSFKGAIEGYDFEAAHDWYAIYPYTSYIKTPANTSDGYVMIGCKDNGQQTQSEANSMAHISGTAAPLYGIAKNVTGKPTFQMKNIASVICFNITNTGDEDLTISSLKFTNETIDLVGSWFINFAQEPLVFTDKYKSPSVTLNITNPATLAKNATAKFYVAVKPGTIPAGDEVELNINNGLIVKTTELANDLTFNAGKIKPLNYSVAKPVLAEETWHKVTSLGDITTGEYIITANGYYAPSATAAQKNVLATAFGITFTDGVYTGTGIIPAMRWNITLESGNYTITNEKGDYLYCVKDNNGLGVGNTEDHWTIEQIGSTETFNIKDTEQNRYLTLYQTSNWRCYTNIYNSGTTAQDSRITLYKKGVLDTRTQLDTPEVIATATGNVVSVGWTDVANAGNYTVTCGDQTQTIDQGEEEATFTMEYNTAYTVTIVANPADETAYRKSAKAETTVTTEVNASAPALDAPVLTVTEATVSWTKVENATGYSWYVLGVSGDATDLTFEGTTEGATATDRRVNVQALTTTPGDYWVTVKALGDNVNYSDSDESEAAGVTIASGAVANVTYTLDFTAATHPADKGNSSYTDSWTATVDGHKWTLLGFNNNYKGWKLIKAGRNKSKESTAYIDTWKVEEAIEHIEVQYKSAVKSQVKSVTITVASDAKFENDVEIYTPAVDDFVKNSGTGHLTITNPQPNRYYRIFYDLAADPKNNGFLVIEKFSYMNFVPAGE